MIELEKLEKLRTRHVVQLSNFDLVDKQCYTCKRSELEVRDSHTLKTRQYCQGEKNSQLICVQLVTSYIPMKYDLKSSPRRNIPPFPMADYIMYNVFEVIYQNLRPGSSHYSDQRWP